MHFKLANGARKRTLPDIGVGYQKFQAYCPDGYLDFFSYFYP